MLDAINTEWSATVRGYTKNETGYTSYLNRVQVGNPLGSIYGFRYKGVYQYTYDYLKNYKSEHDMSDAAFETWLNNEIAAGKTFPVVIGSDGKIIMQANGLPQRMV